MTCNAILIIQFNISNLFAHSSMVSNLENDYVFLFKPTGTTPPSQSGPESNSIEEVFHIPQTPNWGLAIMMQFNVIGRTKIFVVKLLQLIECGLISRQWNSMSSLPDKVITLYLPACIISNRSNYQLGACSRSVVSNVQDYNIVVSKFDPQKRSNVHFRTYSLQKGMNSFIRRSKLWFK